MWAFGLYLGSWLDELAISDLELRLLSRREAGGLRDIGWRRRSSGHNTSAMVSPRRGGYFAVGAGGALCGNRDGMGSLRTQATVSSSAT